MTNIEKQKAKIHSIFRDLLIVETGEQMYTHISGRAMPISHNKIDDLPLISLNGERRK